MELKELETSEKLALLLFAIILIGYTSVVIYYRTIG